MTISTHEKLHPLPGGIVDDSTAAGRDAADMGVVPDFSGMPRQLGANPAVGSWIGFCFVASINKAMPGHMNLRRKGTSGPAGKVRVPLFDSPDG